jgi:hypothetical protein
VVIQKLKDPRAGSYRLSFVINASVGSFFLLLSAVAYGIERIFPLLGSSLSWSFLWTAVVCLLIAALHRAKSRPAA